MVGTSATSEGTIVKSEKEKGCISPFFNPAFLH
jgi:hypothetical protein